MLGKLAAMLALILAMQRAPIVGVNAAYSEPNPDGVQIEDRGPGWEWTDAKQAIVWYGEADRAGKVWLGTPVRREDVPHLAMTVGKVRHAAAWKDGIADFGEFDVKKGPVRMALTTTRTPGPNVGVLWYGGTIRMSTSKRRNAASVHLRWPTAKDTDVRWFYNEATMLTDPAWSYTMACGFARGYFGVQVNDPGRRSVIFSVWDAGTEAVDRDRVAEKDRVRLVAKGDGVVANSFGNEGTGGHSHVDTMWRTGKPLRFLVGCRPEGTDTLYAGYFMAPGDKAWRLVAAFRAPRDGGPLRSLYSFSENYVGSNGQRWRESAFGNGWIGLADGKWQPLTQATFTTDGHGKTDRWDYDAFLKDGRFHLRHGGFVSGMAKYGDALTLVKAGKRPKFDLPALPE